VTGDGGFGEGEDGDRWQGRESGRYGKGNEGGCGGFGGSRGFEYLGALGNLVTITSRLGVSEPRTMMAFVEIAELIHGDLGYDEPMHG
jgi:hypothetical protein